MKKNILKLVFTSSFALVADYSVYASQQEVEMSDLAMANVKALATPEAIRCTSLGMTLYYCKNNMMMFCYCDGARPGSGYVNSIIM